MARKRPAVLTVMGILNIILGSLFLLCNLCLGILLLAMFGGGLDAKLFPGGVNPLSDMWDFMKVEVPGFAVITIGEMVANMVLSAILIIAGIGLLAFRNWGRVLSIIYGVFTIVVRVGGLVFTLAMVNPATARWQQDFQRRHGAAGMGQQNMGDAYMNNIGSVLTTVVSMTYGIVLLIIMLLPAVSAAFATKYQADEYDLDRREDEDDELRRERRQGEDWQE
jgi:hypothetical protein